MKRSHLRLMALTLFSWQACLPAAHAAEATTTFSVTAHVPTSCSISTGPGTLAFGDYADAQKDATTPFGVTCTSGGAYTVGLNNGLNYSAPNRRMTDGASHYLNYELYKELAHTNRWGSAGGELVSGTGTGLEQTLTVYGLLPGSQGLIAGDYTDTITITVTYTP